MMGQLCKEDGALFMVLKPIRHVPIAICQGKVIFHFISHALSLCHQLDYILIQQLDVGSEVWCDTHEGSFCLWLC